jgi:hypothetical protein
MTNTLFTARIKRAPKGDSFKIAVSVNGMNADFRSVDGYTLGDMPRAIAEMASRLNINGSHYIVTHGDSATAIVATPYVVNLAKAGDRQTLPTPPETIAINVPPVTESADKVPAKRSKPEAIAAE